MQIEFTSSSILTLITYSEHKIHYIDFLHVQLILQQGYTYRLFFSSGPDFYVYSANN